MRITPTALAMVLGIALLASGCATSTGPQPAQAPTPAHGKAAVDTTKEDANAGVYAQNRKAFVTIIHLAAMECDVLGDPKSKPQQVSVARTKLERLRLAVKKLPNQVRGVVPVPNDDGETKLTNYHVVADNRRPKEKISKAIQLTFERSKVLEDPFSKGDITRNARFMCADAASVLRQYAIWMQSTPPTAWHLQPMKTARK